MDVFGSIPAAVLVLIVGIPLALVFAFGRQLWTIWREVRRKHVETGEQEDP